MTRIRTLIVIAVAAMSLAVAATPAQASTTYPYPTTLGGTVGPCQVIGDYRYCQWYSTYYDGTWYSMAYGVSDKWGINQLGTITCWYYRSGNAFYPDHCTRGWGTW